MINIFYKLEGWCSKTLDYDLISKSSYRSIQWPNQDAHRSLHNSISFLASAIDLGVTSKGSENAKNSLE